MNSNKDIIIKLQFSSELRKFKIPTQCSFSQFQCIIGTVLNIDDIQNYVFSYLDESMEEVKFNSDIELDLAISSKPIRFIIKRSENEVEIINKLISAQHITEKEPHEEKEMEESKNHQLKMEAIKENIKLATERMKEIAEAMKVIKERLRGKYNQKGIFPANFEEIPEEIKNDRKVLFQYASDLHQLSLKCRSLFHEMKSIRRSSPFPHHTHHHRHPHHRQNHSQDDDAKSSEELEKLREEMREVKEKKREVIVKIESLRLMMNPTNSNQQQLEILSQLSQLKNQLFDLKSQLLSLRSQYKLTRHSLSFHHLQSRHPHHPHRPHHHLHHKFHHHLHQNDRSDNCEWKKLKWRECGGMKRREEREQNKQKIHQLYNQIMEFKSNKHLHESPDLISQLQSLKLQLHSITPFPFHHPCLLHFHHHHRHHRHNHPSAPITPFHSHLNRRFPIHKRFHHIRGGPNPFCSFSAHLPNESVANPSV